MVEEKDQGKTHPVPPECCNRPMVINQHINRRSGPRIVYRCVMCGKSKTNKVKR